MLPRAPLPMPRPPPRLPPRLQAPWGGAGRGRRARRRWSACCAAWRGTRRCRCRRGSGSLASGCCRPPCRDGQLGRRTSRNGQISGWPGCDGHISTAGRAVMVKPAAGELQPATAFPAVAFSLLHLARSVALPLIKRCFISHEALLHLARTAASSRTKRRFISHEALLYLARSVALSRTKRCFISHERRSVIKRRRRRRRRRRQLVAAVTRE
jgi:hypothetical protein